jgi:hypothetical protein
MREKYAEKRSLYKLAQGIVGRGIKDILES